MRLSLIYFFILTLLVSLTSCDEEETTPLHGLTANAGSDQTAMVGETVNLNASSSLDLNGDGFNVAWSFSSRPDGSTASISSATSMAATFVPDLAGDYSVQLTISNLMGESTDQILVSVTAPETVEIGGSYSQDLHLTKLSDNPDVPDYIVTSNLTMSARLTIDPGVRIEVMSDNLIRVTQSGSFVASGTSDMPIVITGTTELPGFWKGIWIQSNNLENTFSHIHVSAAGSNIITTGAPRAGLHLTGARINLNNSRFFDIDGYGVSSPSNDTQAPMENCEFENNNQGAMLISAAQIRFIDTETNFGNQDVVILGTTLNIDVDHVWNAPHNGRYRISAQLNIFDNVTIGEGTELAMDNDVLVRFRGDILKALGTATNPISFKGSLEQAGSWRGITIESSNLENIMEHVHFAHAGHSNLMSGFERAAIGLGNNARATFSNLYFNDIDGYGIYIRHDGARADFNNLNFGQNISFGAIHLHAIHIRGIDNQSDFGNNYVVVDGGQVPESDDVQWQSLLNGKYLFTNAATIWGKVSIQPGSILEFDNDVLVRVRTNGILVANGTSSDNIIFTRREGSLNNWRGITIETSSLENSMDYVEISHAGNANLVSGLGRANLGLHNNSRLTLSNSTISNSLGYGIYLRDSAELIESNNVFSNNATGDSN
jgi:parallel beta-helix repeat protein